MLLFRVIYSNECIPFSYWFPMGTKHTTIALQAPCSTNWATQDQLASFYIDNPGTRGWLFRVQVIFRLEALCTLVYGVYYYVITSIHMVEILLEMHYSAGGHDWGIYSEIVWDIITHIIMQSIECHVCIGNNPDFSKQMWNNKLSNGSKLYELE